MTHTTRSGAKSGPSSSPMSSNRSHRRRQPGASTTTTTVSHSKEEEEEEEDAADEQTPLEAPLSQLSVQAGSSKVNLALCGACLDYFPWDGPPGNNVQSGQELGQKQSLKVMATIPAEHADHQRLSTLDGTGSVFEPCHKGLCSGCFHSYLITRINEAKTGVPLIPLSCAECRNSPSKPNCISDDLVQAVLSDVEWNEFQRQIILGTFKKKFYCPYQDCSAVFDAEDIQLEAHGGQPDTTQVCCPECQRTACVDCGCIWHTGFDCDEFKNRPIFIRDTEDEMVLELARTKHWRRCPKKGCGHTIELSSGCNHITCICGKDFCYLCLADWTVERDARGIVTAQYCARKDKGGPKCPLYTEDSILGNHGQGFRQQRHSMEWIGHDRSSVPYQKANTFTRRLLASRKCGYCSAQCKTRRNMIAHLETSNHDVFDCCAKFYKTREDFNAHVTHSHPSRQWVSAEIALRIQRV